MLEDIIITVTATQTPRGPSVRVEVEQDIFPDVLVDALEMAAEKHRHFMMMDGHLITEPADDGSEFTITVRLAQTDEGPVTSSVLSRNMTAESACSILRRAARFHDRDLFARQVTMKLMEESAKHAQAAGKVRAMVEQQRRKN